ncbi:MAG: hypothetical protein AABZ44_09755, partial [Elusimicrobiota bacterium]
MSIKRYLTVLLGISALAAGNAYAGPDRLAIYGPSSATTTDCSSYTVRSLDSGSNPSSVLEASDVDLTDSGDSDNTGFFYALGDTTCVTPLSSAKLTFSAGESLAAFRYKKTTMTGSPVTLTVTDVAAQGDNLSTQNGTRSVSLTVAGPDRLAISAGPDSVASTDCSLYTLESRDSGNNPAAVTLASDVDLSDGNSGIFYGAGDVSCTTPLAPQRINIPVSSNSMQFRYKKVTTTGSPVTLTATDVAAQGDNLSTQNGTKSVTITTGGGGPDRLAITAGPSSVTTIDCSSYTVRSLDSGSNPTSVLAASDVDLTDPGDSDNTGFFYALGDTTCVTPLSPAKINIPISNSTAFFRYQKTTTAGSPVTLTVTDVAAQGDNLSTQNGMRSVAIIVSVPDRLAISAGPDSVANTDCSLYTVQSRDSGNNPANVTLATSMDLNDPGDSDASGSFYSSGDATCSGGTITQINIPISNNSVGFRYKKTTTAGSPITLTAIDVVAQGDNLSTQNGTKSVTITSSGPDRLAISAGPSSMTTADCTFYTVESRDSGNNPAGVTAASNIDLTDPGDSDASGFFYSSGDVTCSGGTITQINIPISNNSVGFRYKKTTMVGSPVTLTATDAAGGDNLSTQNGTRSVTIVGPDRLAIVAGPTSLTTVSCSSYTVHTRSFDGNAIVVSLTSDVDLTDPGDSDNTGFFYALGDTTCVTP